MSNKTAKPRKTKIKLLPAPLAPVASQKTNLELLPEAIEALARLKANHGVNRTFAVSRGIIMLEQSLLARA